MEIGINERCRYIVTVIMNYILYILIDAGPCGRANGPGGVDANNGSIQTLANNEFPWLVYLYFDNTENDEVWCSGSIIGSKWILTAASCLDVYRYT